MAKRSLNRKGPRRKGGRRRRLMSTAAGPWIVVILIIIAIVGGLFLFVRYALPPVLHALNIDWPPVPPATPTPTPIPTPTRHPIIGMDPTEMQREIELGSEIRFAADPMRFGNEIIFTGGVDSLGGQRNHTIYIYDMQEQTKRIFQGLTIENDDVFQPMMNDRWIVYLDHKRAGGGFIRVFDRESENSYIAKQYYVGKPRLTLQGDRICWTERTGSFMDKVFLFDLNTKENVCLDMLERTIWGQSDSNMSDREVVWAGFATSENSEDETKGAIYSLPLDGSATSKSFFETGTYVHDPMTLGNVRVWSDANHGPNANLWISISEREPKKIAENVTGYALGSEFVAYVENVENERSMHVYLWKDDVDKIISIEGERCIFSGVSGDTVFWFVTGVSQDDILKYAVIGDDAISAPSPMPTPSEQ